MGKQKTLAYVGNPTIRQCFQIAGIALVGQKSGNGFALFEYVHLFVKDRSVQVQEVENAVEYVVVPHFFQVLYAL